MQIRDYVIRRLMIFPLIIVGTSIIVFALSRVGGNPIAIYIEHEMSSEEVAELEERLARFLGIARDSIAPGQATQLMVPRGVTALPLAYAYGPGPGPWLLTAYAAGDTSREC